MWAARASHRIHGFNFSLIINEIFINFENCKQLRSNWDIPHCSYCLPLPTIAFPLINNWNQTCHFLIYKIFYRQIFPKNMNFPAWKWKKVCTKKWNPGNLIQTIKFAFLGEKKKQLNDSYAVDTASCLSDLCSRHAQVWGRINGKIILHYRDYISLPLKEEIWKEEPIQISIKSTEVMMKNAR